MDEAQLFTSGFDKCKEDLAELMNAACLSDLEKWEGVRLAHWSGPFLDDDQSIGSQVPLGHDLFMFKLVFFKQSHFSHRDNAMMKDFADHGKQTSGYIVTLQPNGTPFVVMPLWGGEDRPEAILGVFYQHKATEEQCSLRSMGIEPSRLDTKAVALQVDIEVHPIVKHSP